MKKFLILKNFKTNFKLPHFMTLNDVITNLLIYMKFLHFDNFTFSQLHAIILSQHKNHFNRKTKREGNEKSEIKMN